MSTSQEIIPDAYEIRTRSLAVNIEHPSTDFSNINFTEPVSIISDRSLEEEKTESSVTSKTGGPKKSNHISKQQRIQAFFESQKIYPTL